MNWNKASKGFTISGLAKLSKQKAWAARIKGMPDPSSYS